MHLQDARNLATELMRQHGLIDAGWRFRFDHARRRFGSCRYAEKAITLSRPLVLLNPLLPSGDHSAAPPQRGPMRAWGLRASAAGTRRAIPELSDAEIAIGFRRWSDFSAQLIQQVQMLPMPARPACPALILSSREDAEIDRAALSALAAAWSASLVELPGSHVSPLLGHAWSAAFNIVEAWLATLDLPSA